MASSCAVTTSEVNTSQSLVTTTTQSISTGPSSVSTVVFRTCVQPQVSSQCQETTSTSFITFPGNTTTVTVPATLTVDVPVTVLTTLFESCSSSSSSVSSSASSTSSIPTSTLTSTSSSSSSSSSPSSPSSLTSTGTDTSSTPIFVMTTPPPTIITSSSLVTSGGSTFITSFTSTSTYAAVTVDAQSTGTSSNRRVSAGPVIGGVVGGLAALLLLGLLTWRLVKKQPKFDHFFNSDEDSRHNHRKNPLSEKPSYKYGVVGQQSSDPFSLEPPYSSPAVQNVFGNNMGNTGQAQGTLGNDAGLSHATAGGQAVVGNDGGLGQASGQVGGQAQGPLGNNGGLGQASGQVGGQAQGPLGNNGGLGQTSGLGQSTTGGYGAFGQASGPPGTDGGLGQTVSGGHGIVGNLPLVAHSGDLSVIPLIAGIGTAAVGSGLYAAATSSRPSSSRPSTGSSSQLLGPLVTPAKSHGDYPPVLQSWNTSHGYGQTHPGPSTSPYNNISKNELVPRLSIASVASTPSAYSSSSWIGNSSMKYAGDNSSGGGGPPILPSIGTSSQQHHRRTSSLGRIDSVQMTNNEYYHQPYAEIGSSSLSMGVAAGSSSSQEVPLYDGQGRPLNMHPEKAPLVHLDGGLYQQSPPRDGSSSGNEPPAYIE